jgi:hypothetical protein
VERKMAEQLDAFFDWIGIRWRAILYSFYAGMLFTLGCATCAAAEYTKPAGAPEAYIAEHGVTISVFAASSPVGQGLVIGEKLANGKFTVCGTCALFVSDLAGEIAFKGGEVAYIEGVRGMVNEILARRYPPITGPQPGTTPLERLNFALFEHFALAGGRLVSK